MLFGHFARNPTLSAACSVLPKGPIKQRASQAAEQLNKSQALYQGTTSVVTQAADYKRLGFSPCGPLPYLQPSKLPFSAGSSVVP